MTDKNQKHIHFEKNDDDSFISFLKNKLSKPLLSKTDKDNIENCRNLYDEYKASNEFNLQQEKSIKQIQREHENEIKSQTALKIVNLHYFYRFFQNSKNRNDFKDFFDREHPSLHLDSYPDFDVFAEFYESIYGSNDEKDKINNLVQSSHQKIEHYISGSQNIALRQTSYHHILKTIEKILACEFFTSVPQPKAQYTLVKKNSKLISAKVDIPLSGQKPLSRSNARPRNYDESKEIEQPKISNVDEDGFITIQPKKKPNKSENDGNFKSKDRQNYKKQNRQDGDSKNSKRKERYYEQKVYTKKDSNDQ